VSTQSEKVRISVVIPAFNEESGIVQVITDVRLVLEKAGLRKDEDYEVLVVDDGSTDGTAALAEKSARVLRHPMNLGYGRSLLTGFQAARFDWVLTLDGDGSYPAEEIAKLLPHAPAFDMVIGARQGAHFWGEPGKSFLRLIQLKLSSFVAGVPIPDANSGLRLVRRTSERLHMPIPCYGYSFSTTITLSFILAALPVLFVPVEYAARTGHSKVRMVRDTLRTLQTMLQIILYFNPLKFCVVLGLLPLAPAALLSLRYLVSPHFGDLIAIVLCASASLMTFLFGCLLDAVRLHARRLSGQLKPG
jgi:glycosyltransferase involved in cell wall biosynthesis